MANALNLTSTQLLALRRAADKNSSLLPCKKTPYRTILSLHHRGLVSYESAGHSWRATDEGYRALAMQKRHDEVARAPSPVDLARALKELVEYFGGPMAHAICHEGITTMEKCCRCGRLLRAQELLANVPATWLEGT